MVRKKEFQLSVVVPLLNEEECLPTLIERLEKSLSSITEHYEVILIDDCSTDRSLEIIEAAAMRNPRFKGLSLSATRGHQTALSCGMEVASGDVVISMDADLQHPPELIGALVERWQQGYQVVNTMRRNPGHRSRLKRIVSRLFYFVFNRISDLPLTPDSSDFRLLDRQSVDALNSLSEAFKFHRGLVHYIGFKQTLLPFDCPERHAGHSRYTFKKSMHLASRGIFSFTTIPLKLPFYLGLAVLTIFSVLLLVYFFFSLTGRYAFDVGWTTLMAVSLLSFGVQLLFMGIFGMYIAKIFIETKRRPQYFVSRLIGFEADTLEAQPAAPAPAEGGVEPRRAGTPGAKRDLAPAKRGRMKSIA